MCKLHFRINLRSLKFPDFSLWASDCSLYNKRHVQADNLLRIWNNVHLNLSFLEPLWDAKMKFFALTLWQLFYKVTAPEQHECWLRVTSILQYWIQYFSHPSYCWWRLKRAQLPNLKTMSNQFFILGLSTESLSVLTEGFKSLAWMNLTSIAIGETGLLSRQAGNSSSTGRWV